MTGNADAKYWITRCCVYLFAPTCSAGESDTACPNPYVHGLQYTLATIHSRRQQNRPETVTLVAPPQTPVLPHFHYPVPYICTRSACTPSMHTIPPLATLPMTTLFSSFFVPNLTLLLFWPRDDVITPSHHHVIGHCGLLKSSYATAS